MPLRFPQKTILTLICAFGLTACDAGELAFDGPGQAGWGSILVMGDSILDYNHEEGAAVSDALRDALHRPIVDRAVGGAQMIDDENDILSQYVPSDWSWVVLDGGANDLNDDCGCGACDDVLDEIISEDGRSGVLPEFVDELTQHGVKVMVMGYYDLPLGAEFGFDRCHEAMSRLRARQMRLVDRNARAFFFDPRDVVDVADLDNYADDRVHPSPMGSMLMGEGLAAAIRAAE